MTKTLWTTEEICAATHSSLCSRNQWRATGVTIDSRTVTKGDLFIALKGEKTDGHDYLDDVFKKGAVAAVVEHSPATNHNFVVVRNTQEALRDIGRAARNRFNGTVIGITGSAGKTSTKDMLALVLQDQGKTFATKRSFNSTLTVPLSLASADPTCDYGVFEVGMNQPGEIEKLSKIVRPHVGIITNIAPAHLANFQSVEGIAVEKSQIFQGAASSGFAILPGDSPYLEILHASAKGRGMEEVYTFGTNETCHARLLDTKEQEGRYVHEATIFGKPCTFSFPLPGIHWALNALIALLTIKLLGKDLQKACESLSHFTPPESRGGVTNLKGNIMLVDESYNANPLSISMALASFKSRAVKGRKIVILGDMLELGPQGPELHASLAKHVKEAGTDILLTHGPLMKNLHDTLKDEITAHHLNSLEALEEKLFKTLQEDDAIMIKASLGMKFARIVSVLKEKLSV